MAKFELPDSVFDKEIVSGSIDKATKSANAKVGTDASARMFYAPVESIRVIEGYNVRIPTPDYEAHTRSVADSMKANGYDPAKPLAGYAGKEGEDHVIYVTDGHTRLAAVKMANGEGAEISAIPVVIKPQTTTREDLAVALIQSNEGRPLSAFEKATVVKRLIGYNMEKTEIARRLSMTERNIDNYITLAGAPAKVRDYVIAGAVSATEAVKALNKDPAKAAEVLGEAIKAAKATGKDKATGKHIEAAQQQSSGGDSSPTTAEKSTTTTKTVRGNTTDTLKLAFKSGDETDYETLRETRLINKGVWWSYVPDSDKKKVKIVSDITIELKVTTPAPEESPDAGTGGEPAGGAPSEGAEGEADPLAHAEGIEGL